MRFTVIWLPSALDDLAEIWTGAADRTDVAGASDRLDLRLKTDPLELGESREGIRRVAFDQPLQLTFRVFELDRKVEVIRVRRFGR